MGAEGEAEEGGVGWEPLYVAVLRQRLIELEVRRRIGLGQVELGSLVEGELGLRWTPRWGHRRRSVREVQVEEDRLDRGRVGEEGGDLHLPAANRTHERQHLEDAGEELGPSGRGRRSLGAPVREQLETEEALIRRRDRPWVMARWRARRGPPPYRWPQREA